MFCVASGIAGGGGGGRQVVQQFQAADSKKPQN
jgi:hypothetical protein